MITRLMIEDETHKHDQKEEVNVVPMRKPTFETIPENEREPNEGSEPKS